MSSSGQLAGKLSRLVDRSLNQLEKSVTAVEETGPARTGLGSLPQQLWQLSSAILNIRKEERDSAKQPLETDNIDPDSFLESLASVLTKEDVDKLVTIVKQTGEQDEKDD